MTQLTNIQDGIEELEITILKDTEQQSSWPYQYAKANKLNVQEKTFKFYIACITKKEESTEQNIIAVSVFRREDFSTDEVFSHLLFN